MFFHAFGHHSISITQSNIMTECNAPAHLSSLYVVLSTVQILHYPLLTIWRVTRTYSFSTNKKVPNAAIEVFITDNLVFLKLNVIMLSYGLFIWSCTCTIVSK